MFVVRLQFEQHEFWLRYHKHKKRWITTLHQAIASEFDTMLEANQAAKEYLQVADVALIGYSVVKG